VLEDRRRCGSAKVSSEKQAESHTIDSQLAAVRERVAAEGFELLEELQLQENRQRVRARREGARHLLQGLVVCMQCAYAYTGSKSIRQGQQYVYYLCAGTRSVPAGEQRACDNRPLRADTLEAIVWREIRDLLGDPRRLEQEYLRRLQSSDRVLDGHDPTRLDAQARKLRTGIARMIDGYTFRSTKKLVVVR